MNRKKLLTPLAALAAAAAITLTAASGVLDRADWAAADAWYQTRRAADGEVVLVGIDQRALDEVGRIRATSLGSTVQLKGKAEGFEVLIMEELF